MAPVSGNSARAVNPLCFASFDRVNILELGADGWESFTPRLDLVFRPTEFRVGGRLEALFFYHGAHRAHGEKPAQFSE